MGAYKAGMSEQPDVKPGDWSPRHRRTLEQRAARRTWVLREGDEVSYDLIDDRHLVNILMWLRRQSQQRAQQAADEAGLELGPSGWRLRRHPQFDSLVAEARRRGGQVAAAAALIDSPDPLDEEVVRQGVPRR